ncbi:hypothetical protein WMF39_01205 [Sorangium sp. So ce1504]|uniref:hypothetical protein n=1 Tax=Sorangium sp. So ce1504 TaxID=3133337 RepID=UPI003F5ED4AF
MGTDTNSWNGDGGSSAALFPHLRAAYSRAIAHAWRDSDFLQLLVKESTENEPGAPSGPADAIALNCEWFPSMLGKATDGVREAPDDFAEFGVITARILALTWFDQVFARKLYDAEDARPLVRHRHGLPHVDHDPTIVARLFDGGAPLADDVLRAALWYNAARLMGLLEAARPRGA